MLNSFVPHHCELSDSDFAKISHLVYEECGINLHNGKKELVKARLGKRIRNGAFKSFREYYQYVVGDPSGQEMRYLLDAISTNFTSFFREPKHFEFLRSEFLPERIARNEKNGKKLRFWSAGCSSGEEAYTIAIILLETIPHSSTWDLKVVATDLSTKVLKIAEAGIYDFNRVQSLPPPWIKKYFLRGQDHWRNCVKVKSQLGQYIQFRRLNLMESFRFPEPFDCIFCRNVMIYFDKKTQTALVNRLHGCLEKGGILFIGHSESLTGIDHPFDYLKPAVYQKSK